MLSISIISIFTIFCDFKVVFAGQDSSNESTCIGHSIQTYQKQTAICCRHGIEPKYSGDGQEQDCCSNQTYIIDTQLCCEKSVVFKITDNGRETKCCGSLRYDPKDETKLCCNGKLHEKKLGKRSWCCGQLKMKSNERCCKDLHGDVAIHKKKPYMKCCQTEYYNKGSHYCFRNRKILPLHQKLCGDQLYDTRTNKCCMKKLYNNISDNDPDYDCCGVKVFHKAMKKCCSLSNLIPAATSCCQKESYNTKTERCCDNGPIKFQKHSEQCCGATLYDSKTQGCCGTRSFNISTHTCCSSSGNMVAKYTDNKCCGTTTYNSKAKVCCAFENKIEIVNKSEDNHDSCCSSGSMNVSESFSKNTHYCSLGKVISNEIKMCGSFEYKKDSDICCQGVFEKDGKLNGKKCCGVGTFSKATHLCCTNQIYSRKERRRCDKKPSNGLLNRRPRNMKTSAKGVCRICNDSKRFFVKALKSNGFDVCKRQALKVRIISQRRHSGKRRIKMIIQTDLYSEKDYERKKIEVLLPCSCRRIRASKAILITELEDFRETVRLGDSDILLPWYSSVRKHVLRQWKTCKTKKNDLVVNNMLEIKSFIDYKYNKLTEKNLK
ncbi:Hypothetical predicted protein [Mytilus galloprovincialis]|uniref:Galaxin-like repeats domain-containing protein n=2 Tax=Mytilus galloprovincialis TaxID=29158 RepID=A0A8B6EIY7_MYTGA|nr:Hypothetical predicted protein [Mytilus galloprovincialis]